jgi:hypothetical protein
MGFAMPTDFVAEYRSRTDGELLQLWVERLELLPQARTALQSEIALRGLTEHAAVARDMRGEDNVDAFEGVDESHHRLAPPVAAWGPSITWYWLRELRLRHRTKDGVPVEAKVESTLLTRASKGRGGGSRRVELCYCYDYQGPRDGRTIRDFTIGDKTGRALAFAREPGQTITVLVDPNDPDCSYFPSGFGWIQPLLYGVLFFLLGLQLLAGLIVGVVSLMMSH